MRTSSRAKDPTTARYLRYRPIIDYLVGRTEFDLPTVQRACATEQPGFVTRIVNELADQGWLIREMHDDQFRWNTSRGKFHPMRWLDEQLFGSQVKSSPERDRPRERLLVHGVDQLRTCDLIAILVRSGRPGESAVMAGEKIANAFDGRLQELPMAGRGELKSISSAIEKTAYCQIMAGIELGRRVAAVSNEQVLAKITSSEEAVAFCQAHFARLASDTKQEEFHIVTLDTKNQVIRSHQITVGTLDASLVHPREVFRAAIKDAASSILLVHNHPSGDPTPSSQDITVTERIRESGKTLGIEVLDHIVLGRTTAVSIRAERL